MAFFLLRLHSFDTFATFFSRQNAVLRRGLMVVEGAGRTLHFRTGLVFLLILPGRFLLDVYHFVVARYAPFFLFALLLRCGVLLVWP